MTKNTSYLKNIRRTFKLTQKELADILDVSQSLICKIERGERVLTENLRNSCEYFNLIEFGEINEKEHKK